MDWRGRATERKVKLQLFGLSRNPYHGLAWSSDRTRGKLQLFGVTRNPYHGLAWSSDRTRGKVATFRRLAQPLPWIGVVERATAT